VVKHRKRGGKGRLSNAQVPDENRLAKTKSAWSAYQQGVFIGGKGKRRKEKGLDNAGCLAGILVSKVSVERKILKGDLGDL